MNLILISLLILFFIIFLIIGFFTKNGYLVIGAGIIAILIASVIFFDSENTMKESCYPVINSSSSTNDSGNVTTLNQYTTMCSNETMVYKSSSDNIILNALSLILIIIGIGLMFGSMVNYE